MSEQPAVDPCSRLAARFGIRAVSRPLLVWLVWALASIAALAYVYCCTRNVPYMDDFALVPLITGQQDLNLPWIWSQHNEHRPVVSRLIHFGVFRFVSSDIRTGRFLNVLVVSLAAAWMILLARRLRGHTTFTDSLLPLSILNIGQVEIWLISFALNLLLTACISLLLVGIVAQADRIPPVAWSCNSGSCSYYFLCVVAAASFCFRRSCSGSASSCTLVGGLEFAKAAGHELQASCCSYFVRWLSAATCGATRNRRNTPTRGPSRRSCQPRPNTSAW